MAIQKPPIRGKTNPQTRRTFLAVLVGWAASIHLTS